MELTDLIKQLSPEKRSLAITLVKQLAVADGIVNTEIAQTNGIQHPADGIPQWIAKLTIDGKSEGTIALYERVARGYLKLDPLPTMLSVEQNLANRRKHTSASDIETHQKALKSLFGFLYEHGLWGSNPVAKMQYIKRESKEVEPPSDEVVVKLLRAPFRRKIDKQKFTTVLCMLADTGLRIKEAVSLLKRHVDFERAELRVMGKGSKERTVPISPLTAALLKTYINGHQDSSPYVFPSKTGGHWSQIDFNAMLDHACQRVGVPHVNPHAMRHYFATRALESGAKLDIISKILGHADVGITAKVYRHVKPAEFHQEHADHSPIGKIMPPMLGPGTPAEEVVEGEFTEIK